MALIDTLRRFQQQSAASPTAAPVTPATAAETPVTAFPTTDEWLRERGVFRGPTEGGEAEGVYGRMLADEEGMEQFLPIAQPGMTGFESFERDPEFEEARPRMGFESTLGNIQEVLAGRPGQNTIPKMPIDQLPTWEQFVAWVEQQPGFEYRTIAGRPVPTFVVKPGFGLTGPGAGMLGRQGEQAYDLAELYDKLYFEHPEKKSSFFDSYVNPLGVLTGKNIPAQYLLYGKNPITDAPERALGVDSLAPADVLDKYGQQIVMGMIGYATGGAAAAALGGAGGAAAGAGAGGAAGATTGIAAGTAANVLAQPIVQAAIQGAAQGAVQALLTEQNVLEGALKGAISGGAGAGAVGAAGLDSRYMNAALNGATRAATQAAMNGSDIWQAAAQGAVAGLGGAATGVGRTPTAQAPAASAETGIGPLASPESVTQFMSTVPEATPGTMLPIGGRTLDITAPESIAAAIESGNSLQPYSAPASASPVTVPAGTQDESTADQLGRYASYAAKAYDVYQKLNPDGPPVAQFAPPEQGDLSDDEYRTVLSQSAIDYLGLDATSMAVRGLEPGTQEYLDYILAQADAIVAAAFGGDPTALLEGESVEGLQAAMRGKTADEMQALLRALNVKGVLGSTGFGGEAIDPFTGLTQGLGPLAGAVSDPSRSAAMRGYAGMFGDIARMSGPESRMAFRDFLSRDVDLFDLRKAAKDRRLAGMLQAAQGQMSEEDEKRKQWLQYLRMTGQDAPMFFDEGF